MKPVKQQIEIWREQLKSLKIDWRSPWIAAGALGLSFAVGYGVSSLIHAPKAVIAGAPTESLADEVSALFGKPRAADARRAGPQKPDGFTVWKTHIDTSGASPRLCVEFTQALDQSKGYADYVLTNPDLGKTPAVSVKDDQLCIAGGGFVDRKVTLLKGLPARDGTTLAENVDAPFSFGAKAPYVGFQGEGVILPREDADGVALETINVSKLKIEVWRAPDRNLVRRSLSSGHSTAPDEYSYDEGVGDDGRKVWSGEVAVRSPAGERATTVFPLGAVLKTLRPGAYYIKAVDAGPAQSAKSGGEDEVEGNINGRASAERWILFTDMMLTVYRGQSGLDAVVRSLKTAGPLNGVKVQLVGKDGDPLGAATSDSQGHVRFDAALLKGQAGAAPAMLMAYGPGQDFSVLDLGHAPIDLSAQGVGGRGSTDHSVDLSGRSLNEAGVDGFVYTDRGIYRPGEKVHVEALLRDASSRAIKDRKGYLIFRRPSGIEAARFAFDRTDQGFAGATLTLPKTAPRGRWSASLMVEGLDQPAGGTAFEVEDFAPQRLAVDIGADKNKVLTGQDPFTIPVTTRYLFGAPGAGLKMQGEVRIRADYAPFPAFKDFRFGDESQPFQEKRLDTPEQTTDGAGRAMMVVPGDAGGDSTRPLIAVVSASVFEPGGRPVRETADLKLRDKPLYLGVKADVGDGDNPAVKLSAIGVSAAGQRVAVRNAQYQLIAENWKYEWFQQNGRWQWRRTSRDVVVQQGRIDLAADGSASFLARRLEWGDYRLAISDDATGARTLIRFASGWGASAGASDAPDLVRMSTVAKTNSQGDEIELEVKAPYGGEAQIAVATDRVIQLKTFNVPEGGTKVRFKTDPSWGGGAYILASVIQPRDPVATPTPRRAIGVLYVPLDPKGSRLSVALGTASLVRSHAQVKVPVEVKGLSFGQKAYVSIAAIDQGILNLTKFATPDPVKWYFGKRALGVDYLDDYARLLNPNLGAPANVNFGGDAGLGGEGLSTTPIKTVSLWSGVVELGPDGRGTVTLPAPDFNGELRIMAVAWTDTAVGSAETKMTVREPVVAEVSVPRFLAPGDKAFATVELHNASGVAGLYKAVLNGIDGLIANFTKAYQLLTGQSVIERTPLSASDRPGVGQVRLDTTGPGFADQRVLPLETRNGWGETVRSHADLQAPGQDFALDPNLLSGYAPGTVRVSVSYSPIRGFDPGPIIDSLQRYPYGCTEQVVSTATPWLYARALKQDAKVADHARSAVSEAVGRILDRMSEDGAIGLWRVGDAEAEPWVGAYAVDFLLEAKKLGVAAPQDALDKALNGLRSVSRPQGFANAGYFLEYPQGWWGNNDEKRKYETARLRSRGAAYALYVLAKAGSGDLGRLRWFHDVGFATEPGALARAQVGAGLALLGDQARARDSFAQAISSLGQINENDWYQSKERDLAGLIALAYEAGFADIAHRLEPQLNGVVKDPEDINTQAKARLLQAAAAMLNNAGPYAVDASGADAYAPSRFWVRDPAHARFTVKSRAALWRTVTVRGVPVAAPPASGDGLSLSKTFYTLQGGPVDLSAVTQGQRVVVRISGQSHVGRTTPLIVDDRLPAGFEIETILSNADSRNGPFKFLGDLSSASGAEARDDRYVAAVNVPGNKDFAVAYIARAVTPGAFFLPGAEAKDMYRPSVAAWTSPARLKVQ